MTQVKMKMSLVLVILALLCAGASSAESNCMNEIVSLSPCLEYVTGNTSTPTSGCCIQLANVVKSQPQCLCLIVDDKLGSSLGIKVNRTLALGLPSACNVQTPPPSLCKSNSPASVPSPTEVSPKSGGNSIKLSLPMLFLVFAATYICFNFQDILAY
ncbi:hypothetical protein TSUD_46090 [Trifolium subterraneum]|uniref:Bifunctional inhibitor/plant lipid transfer protein/seed storage helical domain-containing protein n=1 Tax=Trifolium subterraneum TaxID=3900 RepID=A0A2Z6PHN1_TRISU|nr:hypothetical protein TSUD_46090 [Trifolium subterraneum]